MRMTTPMYVPLADMHASGLLDGSLTLLLKSPFDTVPAHSHLNIYYCISYILEDHAGK